MAISGLSRCHGWILRVWAITKNVPDVSGDQISSSKMKTKKRLISEIFAALRNKLQ